MTSDLTIDGQSTGISGTLDLNGHTLTILGDFIQKSGTVDINKGKLNVNKDYIIAGVSSKIDGGETVYTYTYTSGKLKMTNAADYVKVKGNFATYGGDEYSSSYKDNSLLNAGTMEIGGNFSQNGGDYSSSHSEYNSGSVYNFATGGTHKVIFNGEGTQEIYFKGSNYSGFAKLQIENKTGPIVFSTNTKVSSTLTQPGGADIQGREKVTLQNKSAFEDHGAENAAINRYVGNAVNVIPTWMDYEAYINHTGPIETVEPSTQSPTPGITSPPTSTATPTPERTPIPEITPTPPVVAEKITGIVVSHAPNNTNIVEGTALDITGLVVEVRYNNSWNMAITDYTLSGYDPNRLGKQTITVEYMGFKAAFDITVVEKSLTGITITQKPAKREYNQGEQLDTRGMVVTALYNNGTTSEISGYAVSGYSADTVGTQTITVSYGGFTTAFTVTVSAVAQPSGTVAAPKLNISSFIGGKAVTLTCATVGADIYYTTDGTVPTASSTKYTEPIVLTETATIKAIAVKSGMNDSKIASGKISVSTVETPVSSHAAGQLDVGTIITLRSKTSGAMIYYTTDGSEPTTNSTRYKGAIAVTSAMTIKAIAVKDGYKSSGVYEVSYTVPVRQPDSATVSVGSATAASGDTVSLPVYIFTDDSITDYRFTLTYDSSKFEYASVSPAEGVSSADLFTSVSDNTITVLYNGAAIESGEVCNVNLNALSSATDGEYPVTVSNVRVTTTSSNNYDIETVDGSVTLSGSTNSNLNVTADAVITDSEGNSVDKGDISGEITANVTVDDVQNAPEDGAPVLVNIILAVYDRNGALVTMSMNEADLSDINYVFSNTLDIPEGVSVGSIKLMIWNGFSDMTPISAASSIL